MLRVNFELPSRGVTEETKCAYRQFTSVLNRVVQRDQKLALSLVDAVRLHQENLEPFLAGCLKGINDKHPICRISEEGRLGAKEVKAFEDAKSIPYLLGVCFGHMAANETKEDDLFHIIGGN